MYTKAETLAAITHFYHKGEYRFIESVNQLSFTYKKDMQEQHRAELEKQTPPNQTSIPE